MLRELQVEPVEVLQLVDLDAGGGVEIVDLDVKREKTFDAKGKL